MEAPVIQNFHSQIDVLPDLEAISHRAASLFVAVSNKPEASPQGVAVALSGGSTPKGCYQFLGSSPYRDQVDWKHLHLFWADERCVPREHDESNFRAAYDAFLSKVPLPDGNIHRIRGEEEPDRAARNYEDEIRKFFGISGLPTFDLVMLGMGGDGHTASLFPDSKSLKETNRLAVPVYLEKPNWNRITLTLPVLNQAAKILFLVAGRSKSDVLSEVIGEEEKKKRFPAGLIHPVNGSLTWLIDQEAAQKLKVINLE
jgi:6-phosphogluconolactonase